MNEISELRRGVNDIVLGLALCFMGLVLIIAGQRRVDIAEQELAAAPSGTPENATNTIEGTA